MKHDILGTGPTLEGNTELRGGDRSLSVRRSLIHLPLWIALGVLLNLALVHFSTGREGISALASFGLIPTLLSFALAFLPWIVGALRIRIWTGGLGTALSFPAALRIVVSTEVLAAATPTAVGGAPAKATFLYREGISPGSAVALTALGSLEDALFFVVSIPAAIWLSPSLRLRELTMLRPNPGEMASSPEMGQGLAAVGVVILVVFAFAMIWRRYRTRFVAFTRSRRDRWWTQVKTTFALSWRERRRLFLTLPLTALQWTCRYSIVSVLAWGLGLPVDVFLLFALQCLVFSILVLVPSPGGSGGAEGAFLLFHQGLAGTDVAVLLLAWRTLTFFLPVAVGALGLLYPKLRPLRRPDQRASVTRPK